MSEICGWFSLDGKDGQRSPKPSGYRQRLLDDGNFETIVGPGYYAAGKVGKTTLYRDRESGILAVVNGEPRWTSQELAATAAEFGNGRALVSAYKDLGQDLFEKIRGPFSLAVYDVSAGTAFLAVDRIGIRPLCYGIDADGALVFGSTTSAVLSLSSISNDVSYQSVYDYFAFHVVPTPRTIYSNIHRLQPGHLIRFRGHSPSSSPYWIPRTIQPLAAESRELSQELIENLKNAVARNIVNSSTGGFLSGGLDSSTICGTANQLSEFKLKAYSIGFDEEGYDELSFAQVAAEKFGLDWHTYKVTPTDVAEAIESIATFDQPFGNSSAIPTYFCARFAAKNGTTRLLAGDGGDELFGGNERYSKQLTFELYSRLPSILREQLVEKLLPALPSRDGGLVHKLKRYVEQASTQLPDRLFTYQYLFMHDPATIFTAEFLRNVDTNHPLCAARDWYDLGGGDNTIDKMLFFDWKLTLADNDLVKVNNACALSNVDVAYPLLDDDLVDISLKVPPELKLTRHELRVFFKQTFSKFLPDETINKSKHGFGLPFGEWLRRDQQLQTIVDKNIQELAERDIFRRDFLKSMQEQHRNDHAAFYGNNIWVLMMLNAWLESNGRNRMS